MISKKWFAGKESRYVGLISTEDGAMTERFSDWLQQELRRFAGDNVEVIIRSSKQKSVEIIEQKEQKQLEYSVA